MSRREENGGEQEEGGEDGAPQLQIWDSDASQTAVGVLDDDGEEWEVRLVVERVASDLFRGRLVFSSDEESFATAPVLLEESEEEVMRRAANLPESMIRQFFVSARA